MVRGRSSLSFFVLRLSPPPLCIFMDNRPLLLIVPVAPHHSHTRTTVRRRLSL